MGKPADMPGRAGKKKPEDREVRNRKLRAEAENKVARSTGKTPPLKEQDLDGLVHDLEVHQVELEMQNDELRRSQEELEAAKERYFELYDLAPVGYFTLSEKGIILEANLTAANMLGVAPRDLRAQRLSSLIYKEDQDIYYLHRQQLFETQAPQACEMRMVRKDGSLLWAQIEANLARDGRSGKPVCHATMNDITGRKQAVDDLLTSEVRFQNISAITSDIAYSCISGEDGSYSIDWITGAAERITGYSCEEIKAQGCWRFLVVEQDQSLFEQNVTGLTPGTQSSCQLRISHKNGGIVWIASSAKCVQDPKSAGRLLLYGGLADISEEKQAQEKLITGHIMLERAERIAHVGSWEWDIATDTVKWSDELFRIFQRDPREGAPSFAEHPAFYHPDDFALLRQAVGSAIADGTPYELELRAFRKDGEIRVCMSRGVAEMAPGGRPVRLVGSLQDITERKQAEEKFKQSHDLITNLARLVPGVIYQYRLYPDGSSAFPYSSPGMYDIYEVTPEEVREDATAVFGRLHPDDYDRVSDSIQESARTLQIFYCEFRVILPRQGLRWRWSQAHPERMLDGGTLWHGIISDITERKQSEEALRESEQRWQFALEGAGDGLWDWDAQTNQVYFSHRWKAMLGYGDDEIGKTLDEWDKRIHPDDRDRTYAELNPHLEGRAPAYISEHRVLCKDGTYKWILDRGIVISRTPEGKPLRVIGTHSDITQRKQMEQALERSTAQYRLLSEHTADIVWLMDMDFNVTYHSPSSEKQTGFTSQELRNMRLEERTTPGSLKLAMEAFDRDMPWMVADQGFNPTTVLELEFYRKDGTTFWTESKVSVIKDENGKPISILGEARDISERRHAQEKLLKSYESVKKTLDDAINTMVKIVELRDPYTAGHQQKVADLATAIAGEMKLEDTRIDQLRTASLIHDIGKLYIPSDILSKPGKLSEIELGLIKTHSKSGYDIVKGMDFPAAVALAVLQHHERLDGSGYPSQLKGADTLLESKILAVADVVEAMSSHRPYRPALGIDKALEEISNNRGKLYDPDVVDACLELFSSGRFEFKSV